MKKQSRVEELISQSKDVQHATLKNALDKHIKEEQEKESTPLMLLN